MRYIIVTLLILGMAVQSALCVFKPEESPVSPIGFWQTANEDLPAFVYQGILPASATVKTGEAAKIPNDPWFLLGNYRFKLFAHVSGNYQLIAGERSFMRLNMGDKPNSGNSYAELQFAGKENQKVQLTGLNGLAAKPQSCKRMFGCGFASYAYNTNGLTLNRTLSVLPSDSVNTGVSAFLLTITVQNSSKNVLKFNYTEGVAANYVMIAHQRAKPNTRPFQYQYAVENELGLLKVKAYTTSSDSMMFGDRNSISWYDGYPPSMFMVSYENASNAQLILLPDSSGHQQTLSATMPFDLKPGEKTIRRLVIGYVYSNSNNKIRAMAQRLINSGTVQQHPFARQWKKSLPQFPNATDIPLRNEMIWHAYNLEALATYNEFYGETKIHQGMSYVFDWGMLASARDDYQHALPLCYYNPSLVKSTLRYMRKRTTAWGEIRLIEQGYGVANHWVFNTSDQQLFYFQLLSEYLRVTNDYEFLLEETACYPPIQNMPAYNGIETMEQCFKFLRDEVSTGSHGLVRLLNSDWNDAVFFELKEPYMGVVASGESHMNTAMALSVFARLLPQIEKIKSNPHFTRYQSNIVQLHQSITLYRQKLLAAFISDLGNRTFSRRMYFANKPFGDDNMFLEPQGFMLQIPELSVERKQALYNEMKQRLYNGEKLGAREQQAPQFNFQAKGSRENGGFWYSLNAPVIVGVSQFNKEEAWKLFRNMTFNNYAKQFPNFWTSYWSSADNIESSLLPSEGLTDRAGNYWESPVYCSHPHAWLLYCYYYLNTL